uniref:Choline transporter-like protein n=1 Tax=Rodentolepis nana TaxID=102285 RepID=A0A158QJF3_RODNA
LILLLVLMIMIFLRKKIYFASNVIGEASKAIGHMPFTLFWPIFPFAFILGTFALWLFVDLNLRSIATAEGVYLNKTAAESPAYTPWLQIFNFAACLWLINYIIAVDQLTLAGAFATFYFSQSKKRRRDGSSPCYFCGVFLIFGTCASAIIFHSGSLAFGSLLITLLWILRAILLKIERRLKLADNEIAKFFIKCLCCCFWCLDKFLRFLNKNAYIMMAIYGHGFCRSARDVFSLIVRNVVRCWDSDKRFRHSLPVVGVSVTCLSSSSAAAGDHTLCYSSWDLDNRSSY